MLEIRPRRVRETKVRVPGSKSYTHRVLIAAALAAGESVIDGALFSRDTQLTAAALQSFGAQIEADPEARRFRVQGTGGNLESCREPIYLENSGTSMRLLAAVAALGKGEYQLDGSPRMRERPMAELLAALQQLGVPARSLAGNGCPPIVVAGGRLAGGEVKIDCSISSQYLSALLLTAPLTPQGMHIRVSEGPVSRPYIELTLNVMRSFNVSAEHTDYKEFSVSGKQSYRAGEKIVEPDCSQAGYFWAAAAITGTGIEVLNIRSDSSQGDLQFVRVLEQMGCTVDFATDGVAVRGPGDGLRSVEVDMGNMPDLVPTLAVVAAFAEGTTHITNVAHLRAKESDRLAAVAAELEKIGIVSECGPDWITITGGQPHGAVIETYDDHRIAMSFSLVGLRVPGICIENEGCVSKSFPDYWEVFERLGS
jgi:3-phosphoshikimate 1-carboxyvinyltransferase